jgi:hypothetical protein
MDTKPIEGIRSNKKASVNIIVVIILFTMALITLSIMLSPMTFFIELGANFTNGTQNGSLMAIIMNLYPLFLLFILVAGLAAKIASG